jgi:3-phytase
VATSQIAINVRCRARDFSHLWKLGAEPNASTPGELVIRIGDHDLEGDIEGLALATAGGQRLLIASDQGSSSFLVLDRDDGYRPVGRFSCIGAASTDGIEVVNTPLGRDFPKGLFCCHTDISGRPTLVSSWEVISDLLVHTDDSVKIGE